MSKGLANRAQSIELSLEMSSRVFRPSWRRCHFGHLAGTVCGTTLCEHGRASSAEALCLVLGKSIRARKKSLIHS
jgi:hypothetical protein